MADTILAAVACNLDNHILNACLPLLQESRVEAIEWSFDALYQVDEIPDWFLDLLNAYSNEGRLVGHGVFFSLFSGRWSQQQQAWLTQLKQTCRQIRFDHITEHFGFMTGRNFHHGAPMSVPFTKSVLAIGQDRLTRICEACECPVGIENLAFSYTVDEVKRHGDFLEKLVEPVNGFLILDLHNLYCQAHNFSVPFDDLLQLYPLQRVREIHISGGSWQPRMSQPGQSIRRDTHDSAVPPEVFDLLKMALPVCPNLKYVVLEQLGNALQSQASKIDYYEDFIRMQELAKKYAGTKINDPNPFLPPSVGLPSAIVEDEILYHQQLQLSDILERASSVDQAIDQLQRSSLANTCWQIETWDADMIEAAIKIARKWKK